VAALNDRLVPAERGGLRLPERTGFSILDSLLRSPDHVGLVVVHAPIATLSALGRHMERRAAQLARAAIVIGSAPCDDAWRELGTRFGAATSSDPRAVAERIAVAATGVVIAIVESCPTQWGQAVATEIARISDGAGDVKVPVFWLLEDVPPAFRPRAIEVDAVIGRQDARLFWEAAAYEAQELASSRLDRIDALDGWWSAAKAVPLDGRPDAACLSADATALLHRLRLAERSWPAAELSRLGSLSALQELVAARFVASDPQGRLVLASAEIELGEPDVADAGVVAHALEAAMPGDPWAVARASELFAMAGRVELAELASVHALSAVIDPALRADFWHRWSCSLDLLPAGGATARLLRAAELALRLGDVDIALGFARTAAAHEADSHEAMLTLGRAMSARGDLTSSAIVLAKAMANAPDGAARSRVSVELADVHYLAGELDDARRFAQHSLETAIDLDTKLKARNVLGKLLLASASWREAEQHFATDAWDAACGHAFVAEQRARLNRAIAVLLSGRRDEARAMLTSVLQVGEVRGEVRVVAFALMNLAAIAISKYEHGEALRLSERAIDVCRRLGEKVHLAGAITNLAELRLKVGLVQEAEQTLAFGSQTCGPEMAGPLYPLFSLVDARIQLERGRTLRAAELVSAALASEHATMGGKIGECHRVAARIALEDGDLIRAERAIAAARQHITSPYARAEIAVLEAMRARAAGEGFSRAAAEAIALAREADDDIVLAREAHVLAYHAAAGASDPRTAKLHLDCAIALCNREADTLPEPLRRRFHARREIVELYRLDAAVAAGDAPACKRCGDPSCSAAAAALPAVTHAPMPSARKVVGSDPAIVSLVSAIRKIGPSDTTVLIHGESGTGKELVAEALHDASPRRTGPLVKVNCAALVEELLLSELFGHEKGSFTGAAARRRGRFELAEGGTVFLDEIGELSARTQVALLRVLEDRTFERVGGNVPLRANVRIVCATHRDLRAMVARGEFREDLYYRLRQVVLEVPSLRQRIGDLPAITAAILGRIAAERGTPPRRISPRALDALCRHAWPGNVRELENALRAAALFAEGDMIEVEDFTSHVDGLSGLGTGSDRPAPLPARVDEPPCPEPPASQVSAIDRDEASSSDPAKGEARPVEVAYAQIRAGVSLSDMKRQIERECIARALEESGHNITRAAALLGMKRPRLSQLVKQYGFGTVPEEGSWDASKE
jgi:DNA-binding NtrC family response regulator/tetratricopeptide (TPR) repeat protein